MPEKEFVLRVGKFSMEVKILPNPLGKGLIFNGILFMNPILGRWVVLALGVSLAHLLEFFTVENLF